jgi:hypothetical protein
MSFETDTPRVVTPIEPYENDNYNDPVDEDVQSSDIENIYKVTGHWEGYINPIANGELSWRSVKSYEMDSKYAIDIWNNNIYEFSTCILSRWISVATHLFQLAQNSFLAILAIYYF